MAGLIETGIEHTKAAVADKPKWAQAQLLLGRVHFARAVMAERTIKPLKAEEKEKRLESAISAADIRLVELARARFFYRGNGTCMVSMNVCSWSMLQSEMAPGWLATVAPTALAKRAVCSMGQCWMIP